MASEGTRHPALVALLVAGVADTLITAYGIGIHGPGVESNPVVAVPVEWLLAVAPDAALPIFVVAKVAITLAAVAALRLRWDDVRAVPHAPTYLFAVSGIYLLLGPVVNLVVLTA